MMFHKLLLLLIYSTLAAICFGQVSRIESKKDALNELKKSMPDSNRQYVYNFLGTIYLGSAQYDQKMFDSAFYYLRKAVTLGDSLNLQNKEITNESLRWLALTYMWSGNLVKSKQIYLQVITNYQQHNQKRSEANTWFTMGKEFRNFDKNFLETPQYFENAISIYDGEKLYAKKAEAMIEEMILFSSTGNFIKTDALLKQIIKQAKANHLKQCSEIYLMLAALNRNTGSFDKALEYTLEAHKCIDSLDNKLIANVVYGELALTYEALGETDESIFWYQKCIAEREITGYPRSTIYRTASLMINQMVKREKGTAAIIFLQQLVKRNPPVTHLEKAMLSQSFAYCYAAITQYKLAESKYIEMINEYNQSRVEQEVLLIAYYDITKFYADNNQYDKAAFYLSKFFWLTGSSVSLNKDIYYLKFKVDSAKGNFPAAIKYYEQYKELNDSIFTRAKTQQINELRIRYETEKKDNDIKALEKESILQNGKLVQANQTRNWIMGVAILLSIITALLINNSRLKQHTNKKLQVQQKEIQVKNASLQRLLKEKEWLVKEIHHRVKNNLHTIIGLLHTQAGFLKTEEALLAVNESQHRIQAMSLIHEKLFQSQDLSTIEMSGYIHELVDYLRHSFDTGRRIVFKIDAEKLDLKLSHSLPIGLILNEAITNAIKYAFAANDGGIITVCLKHIEGLQYQLSIADNGKGLPGGLDFEKSNTMGMNLMEGLSEDMQGSFAIKNDNGTAINILFLYDSAVADDWVIQQRNGST